MPHGHSSGQYTARTALARVRATGLEPVILSNAKRKEPSVAEDLGAPVIGMAMKPSPRHRRSDEIDRLYSRADNFNW